MERKKFGPGAGGKALLEAVDEVQRLRVSPNQVMYGAALTMADWRRYHKGLEQLREAIIAVDEHDKDLLRNAA